MSESAFFSATLFLYSYSRLVSDFNFFFVGSRILFYRLYGIQTNYWSITFLLSFLIFFVFIPFWDTTVLELPVRHVSLT